MLKRLKRGWVVVLFLISCWISSYGATPLWGQDPANLVEQGIVAYEQRDFSGAIALWETALQQTPTPQNQVILYTNLAQAYRNMGNTGEAIALWEKAIALEPPPEQLVELRLAQGQAYSELGQHSQGLKRLQQALDSLPATGLATARVKAAQGNILAAQGDYEQAVAAQQESLTLLPPESPLKARIFNDLGTIYVRWMERTRDLAYLADLGGDRREVTRLQSLRQGQFEQARSLFEQSLASSSEDAGQVKTLLNLNQLLQEELQQPDATLAQKIADNRERALALLETLPASRDQAYAYLRLAQGESAPEAARLRLNQGLQVAQTLGDVRAESFLFGALGDLELQAGNLRQARPWTQQALQAAQQIQALDSLYLWQWQNGRLLKAEGNTPGAIQAYQGAMATLQHIRGDLLAAQQELQFTFRDRVEPVYRELMDLLLSTSPREGSPPPSDVPRVQQVLSTLEALKLAELQNFFGDECVQSTRQTASDSPPSQDKTTAIIYSLILPQRTELITLLPHGDYHLHTIQKSQTEIQEALKSLRRSLEDISTEEYAIDASQVYDWLIRPLKGVLDAAKIKTLVFIQDGDFRTIPMAALYDQQQQQFLIEQYAIANTPSLELTIRKPISRNQFQALTVGLSVAVQGENFPPLPNVPEETRSVNQILGGTSLLNDQFTLDNLATQLNQQNYPVVHIATHGKFGVDAQSTFLLSYDGRINLSQVDQLLRQRRGENNQPIALLTLSACQTAAGDNRSALGIAGVAVRTGAESALATLWFVNDAATVRLVTDFYRQLERPNITKVQALQQAQINALKDVSTRHPVLWSPFILIGNWL